MMSYTKLPFKVDSEGELGCRYKGQISSLPEETKTVLVEDNHMYKLLLCKDGVAEGNRPIMPAITRVETLGSNLSAPSVVKVYFGDYTTEKAVVSSNDTFNLEQGVSICVAKKALSIISHTNSGHSVYNKIVKHGMRVYETQNVREKQEAYYAECQQEKAKRIAAKKRARQEKRNNEIREACIEIQKEAYMRAMRELNNNTVSEGKSE